MAASLAVYEQTTGGKGVFAAVAVAVPAAWLGGAISPAAPIAVIIVGLAAASGVALPGMANIALGALGGFAAGCAASIDNPGFVAALGAGLSVFLVSGFCLEGFRRLEPILPLARRVIGAWAAAIGLLLAALALR